MTYSGLVTWVKDWFDDPGSLNTPSKDRISVYQAVVLLIRGYMYGDRSEKNLRRIHGYLTYLLLGWNPITAWLKATEFEDPGTEQMEDWSLCVEAMRKMLDLEDKSISKVYTFLAKLSVWCGEFGSTNKSLFVGERITMMMLALWLLDYNCNGYRCLANDLSSVRACLDLAYRSKRIAVGTVDHEYASTNHELRYCMWIKRQMDRLLHLKVDTEKFRSTMAYFGWFVSLVITERSFKTSPRCKTWEMDVGAAVETEIIRHRETLDAASLNCNVDQVRNETDLFVMFQHNPPPVDERFAVKRKS